MNQEHQNIRRLAAALRENLVKCGEDPDVDPVHDTRTGTRRLQATLENLVREMPEDEAGQPVRDGATSLMRVLKKIRQAAGEVRDLDVHRKLLEKLAKRAVDPDGNEEDEGKVKKAAGKTELTDEPDVLETPEAGFRVTGVQGQADHLDAWLKHRRAELAENLRVAAPGLVAKLDKRLQQLDEAIGTTPRRRRQKRPGVLALDSFARLATEMQLLDGLNLHDFRKGAKKARYVAELAVEGDRQSAQVGQALKKLQDEIGDWHDWLVLAEEAHTALGDEATELIGLVEGERERHYVGAMKAASKLRGRLMGEWQALSRRPAARARNGPAVRAAAKPKTGTQ